MARDGSENRVDMLEHGDIYFFYQPRVEEEDPEKLGDLQRLYMVLSPDGEKRYRLIVIGHKQMPEPGRGRNNRRWGFVDMVRKSPKSIRDALSETSYDTRTRGKRHLPAARPAGEGIYRILRHGDHTHLVYALELPKDIGEVQESLDIEPEVSYIVSVKNPERDSARTPGLSAKRQADFPKRLQKRFRDRKFAEVDPPDFLDKEGAEILLIASSEDIEQELGVKLKPENESAASAEIFRDLRMDKSERPTKPLFESEWE